MAIVGSGPSSLENEPGLVDSYDIVVRVNNYKLFPQTGFRTDVFYSFFGASIRKKTEDLAKDGVELCLCKCPNSKPLRSKWHEDNHKQAGIDYRYIYNSRKNWWFCDTYIPDEKVFLEKFEMLDKHIPTTGFAGIIDVLSFGPRELYITGFDFFRSRLHNVNDRWIPRNRDDPLRHDPDRELQVLKQYCRDKPVKCDAVLNGLFARS